MSTVLDTLTVQNTEAETEAAKFGEDVKYLAGRMLGQWRQLLIFKIKFSFFKRVSVTRFFFCFLYKSNPSRPLINKLTFVAINLFYEKIFAKLKTLRCITQREVDKKCGKTLS